MITVDDLRRIFVHALPSALAELGPGLIQTAARYEINTPLRLAHWLAQVGHESGELRYREEIATGAAYEGREDLGNIHFGDGKWFKGRGLIQLTGRANYTAFSRAKGLEDALIREPWLVAADPVLCCDVAGWFWDRAGLNRWADLDDLKRITRTINGGLNGLRDRQRLLTVAKTVLIRDDNSPHSTANLQRMLNAFAGASLSVDGVFGPQTERAVKQFQQQWRLTVDGIPGPKTWAALHLLEASDIE